MRTLLAGGFLTMVGVQAAYALPNCKPGDTSPVCLCHKTSCTTPAVVYGTRSYQPSYLVLSILYAPPGAASTVAFTNTNTEGATVGMSSSFGVGLTTKVSASGGFFGQGTLGASYGVTNTEANSTTVQITSTAANGAQLTSTNDAIDHTQDQYFLWLNPLITVQQTGPKTATYTVGTADGAPMDVINVSLSEVKNSSLIPADKMNPQHIHGLTLPGLGTLKASDFVDMAALDTVTSLTAPPTDSKRYVYVQSVPLEGPDQKGQDAVKNPYTVSDSSATSHVETDSENTATSLSAGEKVEIPGIFSVGVDITGSMTWVYSGSRGTTSGTAKQAAVTLGTSQPGCLEYVDVYSDTMFHTMAFTTPDPVCAPIKSGGGIPVNPGSVFSGLLQDSQGRARPHELVTITFPNGLVRRIVTDSKGRYEVYNAPAGTAQVSAAGMSAPAMVTSKPPAAMQAR